MRQQGAGGAQAVAVDVPHIPADAVQETVYLALRMVEAPGAGPAIAAAEDRLVAVLRLHPAEFAGHQVQRGVPLHLHEGLGAAARGVAAAVALQPALADGGAGDAQPLQLRRQGVQPDGRRVGIFPERLQRNGAPGFQLDLIDAPMHGGEYGHAGWFPSTREGPRLEHDPRSLKQESCSSALFCRVIHALDDATSGDRALGDRRACATSPHAGAWSAAAAMPRR